MPHEIHKEKMASEKSQALYVPTGTCEEKSLKDKGNWCCSKFFLVWILVALLIALFAGLCVQFWFPIKHRLYNDEESSAELVIHGDSENKGQLHYTAMEKQVELTTISKDKVSPPWHLDFLINPTRLCETWDSPETETYQRNPEVKLLILVPSATGHFTQRSTIRRTWGSVAVQPHGPVRLGFVLGITSNATEQILIRHESEAFGDIIQADFVDTFRNLTTKSVLMLKWVAAHCAHARYFLKTDDDTFVNLPVLARVLQKPVYDPSETFIGGYVKKGSIPTRIPSEKHYVSEKDFPELEFPPYADGSAYVTTGPTAMQLYDASQRVTPFLPLEDVFITSLCADDIDAKLVHEPSFLYSVPEDSSWDRLSSFATVHSLVPSDIDNVFDQMTKAFTEALNFSDSSFDSPDFFGSLSLSDIFTWPQKEKYINSAKSVDGGSSESIKSPETKTIFDIFDLVRKQLGVREEDSMSGENKAVDSDLNYEEPPTPEQQINKGNLLRNSEEEEQVQVVHSLVPSDIDNVFDQMTKAFTEALNFSDSSFDSPDFFSSLSLSDIFTWPQKENYINSAKSVNGGSSKSIKSPETKTIFDIFDLVRKQLGVREEDSMSEENKAVDSDLNYEEPPTPKQQINKGNLLRYSEEEEQVQALNRQKGNNSSASFIVYFK